MYKECLGVVKMKSECISKILCMTLVLVFILKTGLDYDQLFLSLNLISK